MSQEKTIVPEFDYGTLEKAGGNDFSQDLYAPSGAAGQSHKTASDGYMSGAVPPPIPEATAIRTEPAAQEQGRSVKMQERVVVGVLFSVSKGLLGEIFPLYLGRNIIGCAPDCDVTLKERTVSSEHAILYIRKNEGGGGYNMTITDYNTPYGTMVNGTDGRYEMLEVRENDVIAIGSHYKLMMKVFDTESAGLAEDEDFEPTDAQGGAGYGSDTIDAEVEVNTTAMNDFYAPTGGDHSRTVIC